MEIKHLLRSQMVNAKGYVPGGTPLPPVPDGVTICKLNANENQFGPSPKVIEVMKEALSQMYLYPLEQTNITRQAIASWQGVDVNNVNLGAGSSSLICAIADLFLNPGDEVLVSNPSYIAYSLMPERYGAKLVGVPSKNNAGNIEGLLKAINPNTKLVVIVNPNNPTGGMNTSKEIDYYFENVPDSVITIVDEAYFEWVDDPNHESAKKHINNKKVIVLRTFSKIFGLAGLRMGYALSNPIIQEQLMKLEFNYGPGRLALIAAREAIKDAQYIQDSIKNNTDGRNYICHEFDQMGINYIKPYGSFVMFTPNKDTNTTLLELNKRGVIVRPFGNQLRVSIGLPNQNKQFIEALKEILGD